MNLQPIKLAGVEDKRPLVIAGPCSAESEEQVMNTATQLSKKGIKIFRAGIWKPRTKPGGFEGIGVEGLAWMQRVKRETGMYVTTEVATAKHVEEALKAGIDILWIGGMERLNNAGITRLGAIHRGFSTYEKKIYRNLPQWHIPLELRRRYPDLPLLCDPSHIGGKRELIAPLCQQAMDLNFDGLIIESHCCPDKAWSDASQQVTPESLEYILDMLVIRDETHSTEDLGQLRKLIDECDDSIIQELAKRMRVAREIGMFKKEHSVTVFQNTRYNEILERRASQAEQCGMSGEFMKKVFEAIHEESVRQQMEILNK